MINALEGNEQFCRFADAIYAAFLTGVIQGVWCCTFNGKDKHNVSFADQRHDTPANRQMVNNIALSFGIPPIFE